MTYLKRISKSFHRRASQYETEATIQNEIGSRLIERLDYFKIQPKRILDLGCGAGQFSQQLKKRYPKAMIVAIDLSKGMLSQSKVKQGWFNKWPLVQGDMNRLPFADCSFDLVFSNQVVHWTQSFQDLCQEINRVMAPKGCFMFSTLGPDTFKELREAWAQVDSFNHVMDFTDMHHLGDILMHASLMDPVMDMEHLTITYQSLKYMLRSIQSQGVVNMHANRPRGLIGRGAWREFEKHYESYQTEQSRYPLTYEAVYGHAWKGDKHVGIKGKESFVSVDSIRTVTN